jgi:hypothetical protein
MNKSPFVIRCLCVAAVTLGMCATARQAGAAPRQDQGKDEISVNTPKGGFDLSGSVKAKEIGLPVYPGATYVSDRDKDQGNLLFSLTRPGKPDVKFVVAKFETADDIGQVRDFYRKKLGHKVTKFSVDAGDGHVSFEMRADNQHARFVALKQSDGRTEIDLVRLEGFDISNDSVN